MKKLFSIIIVSIIFVNVLLLGGCKKNIKDANTVTYTYSSGFSGDLIYDYNTDYYSYYNDNSYCGFVRAYLEINYATFEAVTKGELKLREAPDEDSKEITIINEGETVYIPYLNLHRKSSIADSIDDEGNIWFYVKYKDNKGEKPKPYIVYKSSGLKEGSVLDEFDLESFSKVAVDEEFINDNSYYDYEVSDEKSYLEYKWYYVVGKGGYLYKGSFYHFPKGTLIE